MKINTKSRSPRSKNNSSPHSSPSRPRAAPQPPTPSIAPPAVPQVSPNDYCYEILQHLRYLLPQYQQLSTCARQAPPEEREKWNHDIDRCADQINHFTFLMSRYLPPPPADQDPDLAGYNQLAIAKWEYQAKQQEWEIEQKKVLK